jgi:hypothetical protein
VAKALAFSIVAIEYEAGRGFDGTDRWAVTVDPEDGRGHEIITLSCNDKRDAQLKGGREHIARRGPIPPTCLKQSGKAYYFHNAAEGQRAT